MRLPLILLLSIPFAYSDTICTDGFTVVNSKCLKLFSTPVSHQSAEATCVGYGGTLVTAKNAIDNRGITTIASGADRIWMGLYCFGDNATSCQWDDSTGSPQNYNNFARGFPYSEIGKCVYYSVTGALAGQWISAECGTQLNAFVCELPTTSSDSCTYNYNGYCYLPSDIIGGNGQFVSAQQLCYQSNANLVSIHSQNEIRYINRIYQTRNSSASILLGTTISNAWLDGTPFDFNNADPSSSTSGNCLSMSMNGVGHPKGTWFRSSCDSYQPYLCKRVAGVQPTSTPPVVVVTPAPGNATPCNNLVLFSPGILTSPYFPYTYFNNMDCSYTLTTIGSSRISLTFVSFLTESCCDYVTIYDGDSAQSPALSGRISGGPSMPLIYTSTGNSMFVTFHSDGSNVYTGFSSNFVSVV